MIMTPFCNNVFHPPKIFKSMMKTRQMELPYKKGQHKFTPAMTNGPTQQTSASRQTCVRHVEVTILLTKFNALGSYNDTKTSLVA